MALSELSDCSKLTSLVWLCTTAGNDSRLQVINACNPSEVLDSFTLCNAHVLTIASIPGERQVTSRLSLEEILYSINLFYSLKLFVEWLTFSF